MYKGALHHIAAITLTVERTRVKFKLAQNRTPDSRRAIVAELRKRNRPNDARAAAAVESTLDSTPVERGHAASRTGHPRPVPSSRTPLQ